MNAQVTIQGIMLKFDTPNGPVLVDPDCLVGFVTGDGADITDPAMKADLASHARRTMFGIMVGSPGSGRSSFPLFQSPVGDYRKELAVTLELAAVNAWANLGGKPVTTEKLRAMMQEMAWLPETTRARDEIHQTLGKSKNWTYTDHHWNYVGALDTRPATKQQSVKSAPKPKAPKPRKGGRPKSENHKRLIVAWQKLGSPEKGATVREIYAAMVECGWVTTSKRALHSLASMIRSSGLFEVIEKLPSPGANLGANVYRLKAYNPN